VNIATHLLADGYAGRFDLALLITGDSDLLAPVLHVTQHLRRRVGVINPQRRECVVLRRAATFYKHIRPSALKASQFPEQLLDEHGAFHRPSAWA
jgi:hypothetical protein